MEMVAQLHLVQALVYSVMPAALFLCFLPERKWSKHVRDFTLLPLSLMVGALLAWLPWNSFIYAGRSGQVKGQWILNVACLYIGINLFMFCRIHLGKHDKGNLLKKLCPLSDMLFPMAIWSYYRHKSGPVMMIFRWIPVFMVCSAPLAIFLFYVQPIDKNQTFHPAIQRLNSDVCYQVIVHPVTGNLIVTNDSNEIKLLDPITGKILLSNKSPDDIFINTVDYDPTGDVVMQADPSLGKINHLDAQTLEVKKTIEIVNPINQERRTQWPIRTLTNADNSLYFVYWTASLTYIDSNGVVISNYLKQDGYSDIAYDETRDEFYILPWRQSRLEAVKSASPDKVVRSLEMTEISERIVLDPEKDRAFITVPILSEVIVLDLKTFKPVARFPAFPGVRVVGLDFVGRRIILGGFSPVLDIRSLDDFSLLDRIVAPSWMRWMTVDKKGRAYFTTREFGLFRIELSKLGIPSIRCWLRRHDPFYPVINAAYRIMRHLGYEDPS